jgi:hypothetical protein
MGGLSVRAVEVRKNSTTPPAMLVYLRDQPPGKPVTLTYHLTATTPVRVATPGARIYEYYNPDKR